MRLSVEKRDILSWNKSRRHIFNYIYIQCEFTQPKSEPFGSRCIAHRIHAIGGELKIKNDMHTIFIYYLVLIVHKFVAMRGVRHTRKLFFFDTKKIRTITTLHFFNAVVFNVFEFYQGLQTKLPPPTLPTPWDKSVVNSYIYNHIQYVLKACYPFGEIKLSVHHQ